ncbi:MAG TPA: molybdenum cofactor guanylyltransferase [Rubrobacteraceae bacterium]|nr:molybdenum cofactor guanylyltransferase [Rubrobacteraceae bacterium]
MASGIILAGGASSRMGRDKLSLTVGGVPLIRRVYDVLSSHCAELLVAGAADRLPEIPVARTVEDLRPGREGPLAGIETGLTAARYSLVFVAAADLPFLPADLVGYSLTLLTRERVSVVAPRHEGLHPLCAAYDRAILPQVSAALDTGERSVTRFIRGLRGVRFVEGEELSRFGEPEFFLMNVNSPEDLERARACGGVE